MGDDERREKDPTKREAAFTRWESTGERARRRVTERAVDGFDFVAGMLLAAVAFPLRLGWRGLCAAWRAVRGR